MPNFKSSLEELKAEIDKILIETKTRVYVTVDDIDRLSPQEIIEIFQLVKLNANFANTTFILAYDSGVVINSLTTLFGNFADSYLEKIVQVDYSIPAINKVRVAEIFKEKFLNASPVKNDELYISALSELDDSPIYENLNSIRDVNRLINAISLRLPRIRTQINVSDFVQLEALRVFDSIAYDFIFENKKVLLIRGEKTSKSGSEIGSDKTSKIEFVQGQNFSPGAKKIIIALLLLENSSLYSGIYDKKNIREKRLASVHYFDRYFSLQLTKREIEEGLFSEFELSKRKRRHEIFNELVENDKILSFTDWFPEKIKLTEENIKTIAMDSYLFLSKLNFSGENPFKKDWNYTFVSMFISKLIERLDDIDPRRKLILDMFELKSKEIPFTAVHLCTELFRAKDKFDKGKLYHDHLWKSLFDVEDEHNELFILDVRSFYLAELKKNFSNLLKKFGEYNAEQIDFILVRTAKEFPKIYDKGIEKLFTNIENLIDLMTITISNSYSVSGTNGSGFCLRTSYFYRGMNADDIFRRFNSVDKEQLYESRRKTIDFFNRIHADGFPEETFYDYNTLEIVSRR